MSRNKSKINDEHYKIKLCFSFFLFTNSKISNILSINLKLSI